MAACLRPEPISLPDLEPIAGASSRTLFVEDPTLAPGRTGILELEPDAPEPIAIGDEASVELWSHSCDRQAKGAPLSGSTYPHLTPEEATLGCREVGAPCPTEAFHLDPDRSEWTRVISPAQPWPAATRPTDCALLGRPVELTLPSVHGRAQFEVAIGADGLLGSSNPEGVFRLDVWSLPPGPLPDPTSGLPLVTSSIATSRDWLAALTLPDRRALMVARDGATAIASLDGDRLTIELGHALSPFVMACTSTSGARDLSPREFGLAGGMTDAGLETWMVNDCGGLAKRIDEGVWQDVRRAGDPIRRPPSLAWIGPGEVYAARAVRVGLVHVHDGIVSEEQFDQSPATLAVGPGTEGRVFAAVEDPGFGGTLMYALVDGTWQRWGPREATHLSAFVPLGRTLLVGTGDPRQTAQLRERSFCAGELRLDLRQHNLVSRFTEVNGHIVAATFLPSSANGLDQGVRWSIFDAVLPVLCDEPR